jgi:hypothetical protein
MIRDQELRRLVKSDWAEFEKACDRYLLKACLVLAGSITEALLMNHLEVIGYRTPKGRSPRTMSLGLMLEACVAKGDLSPDVEALCGVLKDYRDLVHPGRVLRERLKPERGQLNVAKQAVQRVVDDLLHAAYRRPEWAADVAFQDALRWTMGGIPSERTVQSHVSRLSEEQLARLIAEVVPQRIFEVSGPDATTQDLPEETFEACRLCLSKAWPNASTESRERAALAVAGAVEWAAAFDEQPYCDALIGDLLDYLRAPARDEIVEEILGAMPSQLKRDVIPAIKGIGRYLRPEQVDAFVSPLARYVVRQAEETVLARWVGSTLVGETAAMSNDNRQRVVDVLDGLVEKAHRHDATRAAERLAAMRFQIEPIAEHDIPR